MLRTNLHHHHQGGRDVHDILIKDYNNSARNSNKDFEGFIVNPSTIVPNPISVGFKKREADGASFSSVANDDMIDPMVVKWGMNQPSSADFETPCAADLVDAFDSSDDDGDEEEATEMDYDNDSFFCNGDDGSIKLLHSPEDIIMNSTASQKMFGSAPHNKSSNLSSTFVSRRGHPSSTKSSGNDEKKDGKSGLDPWKIRFEELCEFHKKFGHCNVPHDYAENPPLAQWIKRQRNQKKNRKRDQPSTLTESREKMLNTLNFCWDAHAAAWEEHWNDLLEFRRKYGHSSVPSNYPENPKLAVWVKSQRRQWKLWKRNLPSSITQERISRMDNIGFDWNPRNL